MLAQTAPLVPLVTPSANDLLDLLPELIVGGGFIALMLLDLVVGKNRWLLAVGSIVVLAAGFGASVWGWSDSGSGHTLYFGAFAYDKFAMFVNCVLLFSAALVILISPQYLNRRGIHYGEYYALIVAATLGMMLLAGAMSLMVIFLGIEGLSLALYVLSGFSRSEERSQEAALKYLLLGGFASGFLLYGMALVYGETGHTQLQQIGAAVKAGAALNPPGNVDPMLLAGVVLIFVGFAFKASLVPFHTWTPDVYQGAPTSVTTFMSVTTKVAAFAVIVRVFTYTFEPLYSHWEVIVAIVAIASIVVGNVAALTQTHVKRMLAYSSIAQAGYILIGVAVGPLSSTSAGNLGTIGVLYYLAAYAVTQIGAFAVITIMAGRGEDLDSYDGLRGLAYRRPFVAAAMGLFLLSLGGFPPTVGFFGKFFVFADAIQANLTVLALWGIAGSAVSVFYYLRVALLMYQRPRDDQKEYPWSRTTIAGGTALLAATAGTLVFGILVAVVFNAAQTAQGAILPAIASTR
jgi:NADH-quinone oxidoreductase subunit N